jgi:hypothetical protein
VVRTFSSAGIPLEDQRSVRFPTVRFSTVTVQRRGLHLGAIELRELDLDPASSVSQGRRLFPFPVSVVHSAPKFASHTPGPGRSQSSALCKSLTKLSHGVWGKPKPFSGKSPGSSDSVTTCDCREPRDTRSGPRAVGKGKIRPRGT